MRGDRPLSDLFERLALRFTPHARGSTDTAVSPRPSSQVYPACAGIDPTQKKLLLRSSSLPRMRGDRPHRRQSCWSRNGFTPHARGSTSPAPAHHSDHRVYPACAGIDRLYMPLYQLPPRLPRMRGDRPRRPRSTMTDISFTPHARGGNL